MPEPEAPQGRILVKDYSERRIRLRTMFGISIGVLALLTFMVAFLATGASSLPAFAVFSLPVLLLSLMLGLSYEGLFLCDLEFSPGRIRLPFRRHRSRGGWRALDEVRFLCIRPNPEAVTDAGLLVRALRGGTFRRMLSRSRIREWSRLGGLLAVTDDEVLWVRENYEVLRFLEEHWNEERALRSSSKESAGA